MGTGEDFNCSKFNIWVQIYKLPFEMHNFKCAAALASLAGIVKENSGKEKEQISWAGEYMNIRVEIDNSKPILPGFFLRRTGIKPIWIQLKYVKLPNLCFHCGLFNHESRMCKKQRSDQGVGWGKWLRADDRSKFNPDWSETEAGAGKFVVVSLEEVNGRGMMIVEGQESTERD